MAEVDTSSYPKSAMPVSPLEVAGKIGALQQQKQAIDQSKLDQANQALTYMTRAMGSLGPNASKEDYLKVGQNAVDQGLVPQNTLNVYQERLQAAPDAPSFYKEFMTAAADHQQQIQMHTGINANLNNGATDYQGKIDPLTGGFRPATQSANQPPPTQPTVNNARTLPTGAPNPDYLQPGIVGPAGPAGVVPAPSQPSARPMPVQRPGLTTGPIGPTVQTGDNFKGRFSGQPAIVTGGAPGAAESIRTGAEGGATALVAARQRASNYQREIFPLEQAIPALEKLGTKGTGPGTDTINNLKSFVLSNIPGVKASDFNGTVADYDKSKKYLTDFVNQTGNSGTNDKLAAAFAGNPSVGISNAAAVDVAKSALALRKMQHAEQIAFEKSELPEKDFQKFSINFNSNQDPRAYGINMMDKDKLKKMLEGMSPEERQTFNKSLITAHDAGVIPKVGK